MLVKNIRTAFAIALALAATSVVGAQDYDKPLISEWPSLTYGYAYGFFRPGNSKVDLEGMISHYVANLKWVPDYYRLGVTYEQALAIAKHQQIGVSILREASMRLHQAEQEGNEQAIRAARRHKSNVLTMVTETGDELFHEMVVKTFDEGQLDTIKSMSVNVIMNHVKLQDLFRPDNELFSESSLTAKELAELRKAVAEVEMEMRREVMELRRKAWDKIMAKLPDELVAKIEDKFGFGGLVKPK